MMTRNGSPVVENPREGMSTILANTYDFRMIPENRESPVPGGNEGYFLYDFLRISLSTFSLGLSGEGIWGERKSWKWRPKRLVAQGFHGSANRAEIARIVLSHRALELLHNATIPGEV